MGLPVRRFEGDVLFLSPELTEPWRRRGACPLLHARYRDDSFPVTMQTNVIPASQAHSPGPAHDNPDFRGSWCGAYKVHFFVRRWWIQKQNPTLF